MFLSPYGNDEVLYFIPKGPILLCLLVSQVAHDISPEFKPTFVQFPPLKFRPYKNQNP